MLPYNFPSECLSQHQYHKSSGPIHPKNQGELLYILGHSLGKNKEVVVHMLSHSKKMANFEAFL